MHNPAREITRANVLYSLSIPFSPRVLLSAQVRRRLRRDLVRGFLATLAFWPIVQTFNFCAVPLHQQAR